ncbi:DNA-invertase hin [Aliiroseovarius sp. xm-v-225]|uniref:recombinase family protein n=1 Tax=unclassified Aliiroseovarius TaxID=2623558 RepID=UPI00156A376B|nr:MULTISPECIES: recombinase family protein [unclassified Aliiroseovarius]NRP43665.1 DNA-invertase hin [Aliiroseovarius sp. xm-m-378]NRP64536.1 DNA-invertase hin [Aliiroseovarius sp. xm-v-225]NRP92299.1 DNA-invertase hin [Aliiroseovarius sp. xm-a-134]
MGELIGYARVSSRGQNIEPQIDALMRVGVCSAHMYQEKVSGTSRNGRVELEALLHRGIRKGDKLVVTRLDRLARSMRDLQNIAHELKEREVDLVVLEQSIDTSTAEGRLFFNMLGAIGEFETELRKVRQREGIDAALAKGADSPFKGRPATIDGKRIAALREEGKSPTAIAKELGIARSSVYRYLNELHTSA